MSETTLLLDCQLRFRKNLLLNDCYDKINIFDNRSEQRPMRIRQANC